MIDKSETEDQYFQRTGIFKISLDVEIKISEVDLLKDLVKNTEGKKIPIKPPAGIENN